KAIYICPLRALASEHFRDFRRKYRKYGIKIAISTGDFDSSSRYLSNYDVIFLTYEKLDSLQRHNASWLHDVALLVVDEIHTISSSRGPTLEVAITKQMLNNKQLQILALSATIPNAKEIAKWLNAKLIKSDYRPIPLKEGVLFGKKIFYEDMEEELNSESSGLTALAEDTLTKGKQILCFANSRKRAEQIAEKLSKISEKFLTKREIKSLERISNSIITTLEVPTEQCKKLAKLVKHGSAFHHAGLLAKQRKLIEDAFREGKLKIIASTPTLAMGVNLPAYTVAIPSLYRFEEYGMQPISVSEYKQLAGRAGRPKYDNEGRAISIASSEARIRDIFENYINAEPEEVVSMLHNESLLRQHILALIAADFIYDLASLEDFFSKTFFALQSKNEELFIKIQDIITELADMNFLVSSATRFKVTPLGRRVAELYIDPLSANFIIEKIKERARISQLGYLFLISSAVEFPKFRVPKGLEIEFFEKLESAKLPIDTTKSYFFDAEILEKFFSAFILNEWIEETKESRLEEEYAVLPGTLYSRIQIAEWIAYAASELAKMLKLKEHAYNFALLQNRLKYGVRPELLNLVQLRGVGRVRARKLYNAKLRTISSLKKIDIKDLARIVGKKTAETIKAQLKAGRTGKI
ncbi:MAG: DEAD/DEAH box helicase, partial [Candidatus Diapherotrites archaeon]|nr:DEAD/DEAH box helicase [Candidatus Diapherotrites archaeon]